MIVVNPLTGFWCMYFVWKWKSGKGEKQLDPSTPVTWVDQTQRGRYSWVGDGLQSGMQFTATVGIAEKLKEPHIRFAMLRTLLKTFLQVYPLAYPCCPITVCLLRIQRLFSIGRYKQQFSGQIRRSVWKGTAGDKRLRWQTREISDESGTNVRDVYVCCGWPVLSCDVNLSSLWKNLGSSNQQ